MKKCALIVLLFLEKNLIKKEQSKILNPTIYFNSSLFLHVYEISSQFRKRF